jgi:hypothetical protein
MGLLDSRPLRGPDCTAPSVVPAAARLHEVRRDELGDRPADLLAPRADPSGSECRRGFGSPTAPRRLPRTRGTRASRPAARRTDATSIIPRRAVTITTASPSTAKSTTDGPREGVDRPRQRDLQAGDHPHADRSFKDALKAFRELGHQRGAARQLESLAWCATCQARDEQAVALTSAAAAIRQRIAAPPKPAEPRRSNGR